MIQNIYIIEWYCCSNP